MWLCVEDASGEPTVSPCPGSDDIIQGHLFKRSRRKSRTWKRCRVCRTGLCFIGEPSSSPRHQLCSCFRSWFSIRDNKLLYRKSHKVRLNFLWDRSRSRTPQESLRGVLMGPSSYFNKIKPHVNTYCTGFGGPGPVLPETTARSRSACSAAGGEPGSVRGSPSVCRPTSGEPGPAVLLRAAVCPQVRLCLSSQLIGSC